EIVAKAKKDSEALIERRTRMAEDKIAAEERAAVEQLRAAAADAAAKAAARIIADRHDASTDARLVDQAIKEIGRYILLLVPSAGFADAYQRFARHVFVGSAAQIAQTDDSAQPLLIVDHG